MFSNDSFSATFWQIFPVVRCVFYSCGHVCRIAIFHKMRIINIRCDNKQPDKNARWERCYWQAHFPTEPPPDAAARSAPCLGGIMWALVCLQLLLILFLTQFLAVNGELMKKMQFFCNSLEFFFFNHIHQKPPKSPTYVNAVFTDGFYGLKVVETFIWRELKFYWLCAEVAVRDKKKPSVAWKLRRS